jgi:hypothetical protein
MAAAPGRAATEIHLVHPDFDAEQATVAGTPTAARVGALWDVVTKAAQSPTPQALTRLTDGGGGSFGRDAVALGDATPPAPLNGAALLVTAMVLALKVGPVHVAALADAVSAAAAVAGAGGRAVVAKFVERGVEYAGLAPAVPALARAGERDEMCLSATYDVPAGGAAHRPAGFAPRAPINPAAHSLRPTPLPQHAHTAGVIARLVNWLGDADTTIDVRVSAGLALVRAAGSGPDKEAPLVGAGCLGVLTALLTTDTGGLDTPELPLAVQSAACGVLAIVAHCYAERRDPSLGVFVAPLSRCLTRALAARAATTLRRGVVDEPADVYLHGATGTICNLVGQLRNATAVLCRRARRRAVPRHPP